MVILMFLAAFIGVQTVSAEKKAPDTVTLKLEGAKMNPVNFPHSAHVQKVKVNCVVCHHKDKDMKEPQLCEKCHAASGEAKGNVATAKDAFHGKCITCHKENADKGGKAPTKCMECHKK